MVKYFAIIDYFLNMSKRRINKQQSARIQKIQTVHLQDTISTDPSLNEEGTVIARYSRHAEIETLSGHRLRCSIRPHIETIVAGDRVVWQKSGPSQGVIVSLFPRESVLGRPDKKGQIKPVAANITQLMIVVAVKPELNWPLLDSYLVMADYLELKVCIVLNKVDIPSASLQQRLKHIYQALGYDILFVSKEKNIGYPELEEKLQHQTSVFVGQSGVGKSSIISKILPHEDNIQTAEISSGSELGCHTTSNSRLYHIPSGGNLIDSPGVREFSLWKMPLKNIIHGFREFRTLTEHCKYRNCNHLDAPGCAIIAQVEKKLASHERYESLKKMILSAG